MIGTDEWGNRSGTPLDDLSPEQLDALPYGVIGVDSEGRVTSYNATEGRLSGRSPDRVIGRDFFREVAPCTHLPSFHGRFLDGVRRGHLATEFTFVFGFDPPVRVRVAMRNARVPGRYWITVHPIGALAPSAQRLVSRTAEEVVERRSRAEPVDAGVCEREPIHRPGAVQPHAVMLAFHLAALTVDACSDNVADTFGRGPDELLGETLEELLPTQLVGVLRAALAKGALADPARPLRRDIRLGAEGRPFTVAAHRHDERLIVELEALPERPEDFGAASPFQATDAVRELRAAPTLARASAVCADEIHAMTGFERVLVYRFDADWNGEAIAESRVESWDDTLLGLRFPASDIPAQARALYTRAPARWVVDRDAVPAAVLSGPQARNTAVDLTYVASRALSPVHLEYQRNLGVNGSMSASILVEGALWGLVIGHHRRPHYVTPETRALAGLVAEAFALRLHELGSVEAMREQGAALATQNVLLERLAGADDFVAALTSSGGGAASLLDLFGANSAAVVSEGRVACVGSTPPCEELAGLASWLRATLPPDQQVFATDDLSAHHAPAAAWRESASGALAAFVDEARQHLLVWLRPEITTTVVWGGDPRKSVLADPSTCVVLPRRSFERWVEERRGRAEPWAPWQLGAARALAAAIEGVVLRQGRKIAELSAKGEELSRALEAKDILAREIDHRVKNSLQIVAGVMLMQARGVSDPVARAAFEDTYARVMSVARVHDTLHRSEDIENVDLGATLLRLCDDLASGMTGAERRLAVATEPGLMVPSGVAVALSLIATELVTNALKYAYRPGEEGPVEVSIRGRNGGGVELRVCDAGRGLPPGWESKPAPGTSGGLGMRVIRAMLGRIGADMAVEGDRNPGTCFTVRA
ncbi:GAF domain-containing protein [Roseomonas sp. KE2513]|uniref:histidine kinase dimerization/phosphoacceptor domain -containing protein n=1 Tax=Roseomonas sp. KE2513 TaxID=2479202 RepID=UPI0018DF5912|nr:histidine kinase dimerization/phosphoacceptor domain -containing protein [Roseomonas sp. KE2513]MBI0538552.1 GAF domain-containing protein [Roseomonas sp. KE2513]